LYDNRQKVDYADLIKFDADDVKGWFNEAKEFVNEIESILEK
jgi:uncharacterized protein